MYYTGIQGGGRHEERKSGQRGGVNKGQGKVRGKVGKMARNPKGTACARAGRGASKAGAKAKRSTHMWGGGSGHNGITSKVLGRCGETWARSANKVPLGRVQGHGMGQGRQLLGKVVVQCCHTKHGANQAYNGTGNTWSQLTCKKKVKWGLRRLWCVYKGRHRHTNTINWLGKGPTRRRKAKVTTHNGMHKGKAQQKQDTVNNPRG